MRCSFATASSTTTCCSKIRCACIERLIELHKDNFSMSPYPLDRHGFTNADSWLDEYKRIYRLFESNLR